MNDRKPFIIFAAFLLIMGGVIFTTHRHSSKSTNTNNTSSTKSTPTTNASSAVTTTSTTANTSNTTTSSTAITGPVDWQATFDHVVSVQNDLLKNPDPTRVGEIMDISCTCFNETQSGLQTLKNNNWHVQGDTLRTSAVALVSRTDTQLRISATFVGTNSPTVDQNGTVKEPGSTGLRQPILYVLKKNTNGVWLIFDRHTYEER